MSVTASDLHRLKPRIVVIGVGGAGGNAVDNMIQAGLEGVEFVAANTDAQALTLSKTNSRVQLGVKLTQGLGAGGHPDVGMSAAEESTDEIGAYLEGAHMVFITAGMGGGTGTGAAPIVARCAREQGALTVGVVTKPFSFEGRHRMRLAEAGIAELQACVDTLIVIPNQNLFRIAGARTRFAEAFVMADQVLHAAVRSITDLMVLPGLINLDFADVRTVMSEMGTAMMGAGEAGGEGRALAAAQNALQNPLLEDITLGGAKAVLVNVTGGPDMTLMEVDAAVNAIAGEVDPEANIIFGAAFDPTLKDTLRVSVVATGMAPNQAAAQTRGWASAYRPSASITTAAHVALATPAAAATPSPAALHAAGETATEAAVETAGDTELHEASANDDVSERQERRESRPDPWLEKAVAPKGGEAKPPPEIPPTWAWPEGEADAPGYLRGAESDAANPSEPATAQPPASEPNDDLDPITRRLFHWRS